MKLWERLLVIALLVAIAWIAIWDARRTSEAWLGVAGYVTVYFSDADASGLVPERRPYAKGQDPVAQTLAALIQGPQQPGLYPTIPSGVRVLSTRQEGTTLYVDFSRELRTHHWGGSAGEMLTVYSIVNSLTSLPGIEQVVILIEGELQETLAGHLVLDEPLRRADDLIRE